MDKTHMEINESCKKKKNESWAKIMCENKWIICDSLCENEFQKSHKNIRWNWKCET